MYAHLVRLAFREAEFGLLSLIAGTAAAFFLDDRRSIDAARSYSSVAADGVSSLPASRELFIQSGHSGAGHSNFRSTCHKLP